MCYGGDEPPARPGRKAAVLPTALLTDNGFSLNTAVFFIYFFWSGSFCNYIYGRACKFASSSLYALVGVNQQHHLWSFHPQHGHLASLCESSRSYIWWHWCLSLNIYYNKKGEKKKKHQQSCLSSWAPGGIIVFPFSSVSFKGFCCW